MACPSDQAIGNSVVRLTTFMASCDVRVWTGERRQLVHVDRLECLGVGGDDTKEIVGLTHHAGRLDDRRIVWIACSISSIDTRVTEVRVTHTIGS